MSKTNNQTNEYIVTSNLSEKSGYAMTTEFPVTNSSDKELIDFAEGIFSILSGESQVETLEDVSLPENNKNPYQKFISGLAYISGIDVEVDGEKALMLITKSAEAGLDEAYKKLVSMYQNDYGVSEDYHIATEWQRKYVSYLEHMYYLLTIDEPFEYDKLDEPEQFEIESTLNELLRGLWDLGDFEILLDNLKSAKNTTSLINSIN